MKFKDAIKMLEKLGFEVKLFCNKHKQYRAVKKGLTQYIIFAPYMAFDELQTTNIRVVRSEYMGYEQECYLGAPWDCLAQAIDHCG